MKSLDRRVVAALAAASFLASSPAAAFDLDDYGTTYSATLAAYTKARNEYDRAKAKYFAFQPAATAVGCATGGYTSMGSALSMAPPVVDLAPTAWGLARVLGNRWSSDQQCLLTGVPGGSAPAAVTARSAVQRLINTGYLSSTARSKLLSDVAAYESSHRSLGLSAPLTSTEVLAAVDTDLSDMAASYGVSLGSYSRTNPPTTAACVTPDATGVGEVFCTVYRMYRDTVMKSSYELMLATGPMMASQRAYGRAGRTYYSAPRCGGYLMPSTAVFRLP